MALFFCTNDPNWPLWVCLYGLTCAVFVFLSPPASKPIASSGGTISNARQFASWTYYLHKQVNIIDMMTYIGIVFCTFFLARSRCLYRLSTRSTAALCLSGRRGWSLSIYLIVDEKGDFKEENFQKAMGLLKDGEGSRVRRKGGTKGRGKSDRTREKVLSVVT